MPDSNTSRITPTTRKIPDYTGKRSEAVVLAKRLEQHYHKRGYTKVRCWVEAETRGDRKLWGTRSNIVFDASQLHD